MGTVLEFKKPAPKPPVYRPGAPTLHLMTQRNQPYGSQRRSCEQCYVWVHGDMGYTEDEDFYNSTKHKMNRCRDVPKD